ncbi:MAG: hypothetical protein WC483_03585 [Candidatus Paceibacterota bacterium]
MRRWIEDGRRERADGRSDAPPFDDGGLLLLPPLRPADRPILITFSRRLFVVAAPLPP